MSAARPLAIDLFSGLGGWAEGLLAEGYRVIGFDIERHRYPERVLPNRGQKGMPGIKLHDQGIRGDSRGRSFNYSNECDLRDSPETGRWAEYPAQLVIQDVLTLHGSQFKDAALIVASPPCQEYSYMAMPWKLAKAKAAAIRADTSGQMLADLNRLFDACFRIQAQASLAAGRHVPMVVENVRGAQPWVGRARWNFGSYYLWGDVPALMPFTANRALKGGDQFRPYRAVLGGDPSQRTGDWTAGHKVPGFRFDGGGGVMGIKQTAPADFVARRRPGMSENRGGDFWFQEGASRHGSKSSARKAASAMIAKIPAPLAQWIAQCYR
jgi:hypothetical protein